MVVTMEKNAKIIIFGLLVLLGVALLGYGAFVHCILLLGFVYQWGDQVFVFASVGVRELAAYFVMAQCASLIALESPSVNVGRTKT